MLLLGPESALLCTDDRPNLEEDNVDASVLVELRMVLEDIFLDGRTFTPKDVLFFSCFKVDVSMMDTKIEYILHINC